MPLAIPTVDTISAKECISMSKKYNIYDEDIEYIYDSKNYFSDILKQFFKTKRK